MFSESISKLEQGPSLADMKPCASLGGAASGSCRITEALKAQAQAAGVRAVLFKEHAFERLGSIVQGILKPEP